MQGGYFVFILFYFLIINGLETLLKIVYKLYDYTIIKILYRSNLRMHFFIYFNLNFHIRQYEVKPVI